VTPTPLQAAVKLWLSAYRVELILFAVSFAIFAGFSSQRFLRQSAAPHFVYQAKAWLDGRLDLDPQVLPNLEDWACVRELNGEKHRCEGQVLPTDKWYVSFPSFPAVVMLPFVALHGYQFNDTSFGVFFGASRWRCSTRGSDSCSSARQRPHRRREHRARGRARLRHAVLLLRHSR